MIRNELAILMAKKKIKITEISKRTGISRTTLTSLYYERARGISFETIEELCKFFKCDIKDLLRMGGDKEDE